MSKIITFLIYNPLTIWMTMFSFICYKDIRQRILQKFSQYNISGRHLKLNSTYSLNISKFKICCYNSTIFFNMRVDVYNSFFEGCQRTVIARGIITITKKTYSQERQYNVPYFPGTKTSNREIIGHQQACQDKSQDNYNK